VGVKRKQHSAQLKAQVAMAAMSREKTLNLLFFMSVILLG